MARSKLFNIDLKKINELKSQLPKGASEALEKFQTQISTYEEKVKHIVQDLDEKREKVQRDVQKLGKQRLNRFAVDLKKTRGTVEKRVVQLVGETRKDLQTRVNELVIYLTGLAGKDVINTTKKAKKTKKATKKSSSARKSKAKRVMTGRSNSRSSTSASAGLSPA